MRLLRHIAFRFRAHRATAVAVGVVVLVAIPTGFLLPADAWGALGQWMGAAGTVLAVMIALRIARAEATAEAARTQAENREKELAQARLITGELIYASAEAENHFRAELPETVRITNHSDGQIIRPARRRLRSPQRRHRQLAIANLDAPRSVSGRARSTPWPQVRPTVVPCACATFPIRHPSSTRGLRRSSDLPTRVAAGGVAHTGTATPEQVTENDTFDIGGPDWYRAEPS
jgi:hypothetical protein